MKPSTTGPFELQPVSSARARVLFAGVCALALLILAAPLFLTPRFVEVLMDLGLRGSDLPALTQAAISLCNFVSTKWYLLVWPLLGLLCYPALVLFGAAPVPGRRALYITLSLLVLLLLLFAASMALPYLNVVHGLRSGGMEGMAE